MVEKIRPNAKAEWTDGNDGRDGHYYVEYSCPKCHRRIFTDEMACDNCGTFFDWSKHARLQVEYSAVWE